MVALIKVVGGIVIFGNLLFLVLDLWDYWKFDLERNKKYERIGDMLIERKSSDGEKT